MTAAQLRAAIIRLSRLAGQGTAEDWQADLGPDLKRALKDLGEYAGGAVQRVMDEDMYRPTPARLREAGADVQREHGLARDRSGCAECGMMGWRIIRTYRGERAAPRQREAAAPCDCAMGQCILSGLQAKEGRMRYAGWRAILDGVEATAGQGRDREPLLSVHVLGAAGWYPPLPLRKRSEPCD